MFRSKAAFPLVATLTLAACQQPVESAPQTSRAPAIEALGPAVDCIQTSSIRDTRVHDDYTIDFHMIDGTIYRNTLPNRCPSLGFEERFSYSTTIGRLCSVDVIRVLYSGGTTGPGCGLGEFLPVRISKADARQGQP